MKADKQKKNRAIIILIVAFAGYFVLDYINSPNLLGIHISNLNMNIFSTVLNSFIVVHLYVITYFIWNKRQIQKENNAKETVNVLMGASYKICLENIKLLEDKEILEKYIVPKVNFDEINLNNQVVQNLQMQPFSTLDSVMQLAVNGSVEKEKLKKYLEIMDDYKSFVSLKITFFDIDKAETIKQMELKDYIGAKQLKLMKRLQEEISI